MEALHDFKPWRPLSAQRRASCAKLETTSQSWHPWCAFHPVSGRRVLYVNQQFCVRIKDLKTDESDTLGLLYRRPPFPSISFV